MPLPEAAVQRLQQEKPQTYNALAGLVTALAENPNDDATTATLVTTIAGQLEAAGAEPGPRPPQPRSPNNLSSSPTNRAAISAQMRPASARQLPGAPPTAP